MPQARCLPVFFLSLSLSLCRWPLTWINFQREPQCQVPSSTRRQPQIHRSSLCHVCFSPRRSKNGRSKHTSDLKNVYDTSARREKTATKERNAESVRVVSPILRARNRKSFGEARTPDPTACCGCRCCCCCCCCCSFCRRSNDD
jgi:hypothetical protein